MKGMDDQILKQIANDYPDQVTHFYEHPEIEPAVKKSYLGELCGDNEILVELFDEMISYFYRYSVDVCEQESLIKEGVEENFEEIQTRDIARTRLHNAMIDSVKIFSRNLAAQGKDTKWFEAIDRGGRAGYAHLALLTTFLDIIQREKETNGNI